MRIGRLEAAWAANRQIISRLKTNGPAAQ